MVDIAMCSRRDCPNKNTCFRYLAMPSEVQSYIKVEKPILDGECSMYWKCSTPKELRLMNRLNRDELD